MAKQESSVGPAGGSWFERHYCLLRRLHSLSGVVPIGLFLMFHLTTNASSVWGAINMDKGGTPVDRGVATFQHEVNFIHSLPALVLMEIFVLWIPILFHSIFGFYIARTGRSNTGEYRYGGNVRYTLQRLSGYLGFLFVIYHVATLRWGWTFLIPGGTKWSYAYASSTMAQILQGSDAGLTVAGVLLSVFYLAGVTALVFHFANGLWTAAITWGVTVSPLSQRRWGVACAAIGAGLLALGWMAVIRFATLDVEQARRVEAKLMPELLRMELQEKGELKAVPGVASGGAAATETTTE